MPRINVVNASWMTAVLWMIYFSSAAAAAVDNVVGIANTGSPATDGGLDDDGYAYSATLLGTSISWAGSTFTLGAAGAPDAASGTTIALPAGHVSTVKLLATAVNGNRPNQTFIVTYTDGTTTRITQSLSDWCTPQDYAGESQVLKMAYRIAPSGATSNSYGPIHLYGYSFAINSAKTVQSITLPDNRNVVVLAVDVSPIDVSPTGSAPSSLPTGSAPSSLPTGSAPSSLGRVDNVVGIVAEGSRVTDGGLDNDGYAYAATLLGTSLGWADSKFTLGAAGAYDAVSSTTIALPAGNDSTVNLLATAVNGNQPNQTFIVTYTDGTTASFTQSLSDWYTPQRYAGETKVSEMAYRIAPSGATDNRTFYLYGYSFAVNSKKTVKSLTLPHNRNVVVLAVDVATTGTVPFTAAAPSLSPAPGTYTAARAITLSDSTPGAAIHYTTNGSTPTTSSAHYSGGTPLQVSSTTTIKAIAVASGYSNSAVTGGTYTIASATTPPATTPPPSAKTLKISGTPATTAEVGKFYSFTPTVVATAGSSLTYAVANKPAWAQFSAPTGTLSGTPAAGSAATDADIVVSVSNGATRASLPAFSIAVAPAVVTPDPPPPVSPPVTAGARSCTDTSGPLALKVNAVRSAGISPLLVFFDATGTTDSSISGNTTAFQDVYYSWNFGDNNASGTDTWAYGSNAGHNSKNTATGGVASHLYVAPGADTAYTVTVTAHDGTNTASCQLGVTAYDPSGANGFSSTTCFYNSTLGSGCPAGATQIATSNISTPGSGQQFLYKCGDRFGGNASIARSTTTAAMGAYGSCVGTAISSSNHSTFPQFTGGGNTITLNADNSLTGPTDVRFSNIDFESGATVAISTGAGFNTKQITLYNLYESGLQSAYYISGGTQNGLIQSVMTGMTTRIGTFWNYFGNYCMNGSGAYQCGQGASAVFNNVNYNALIGNSFNGQGAPNNGSGIEVVRVSACRLCVIENNTHENANNIGATLKLHNGSNQSQAQWIGQYTELTEISDNLFTGTAGAQLVETAPQNGNYDERLRNIVVERNLFKGVPNGGGGRQILVSAVNETLRDNIFYVTGGDTDSPQFGAQIAERANEPVPQYIEFYNNTCYALATMSTCAGFDGSNFNASGINSWAKNNLFYDNGSNSSVVVNNGAGNTISNNTTNSSSNPGMTNGSGSFSLISDFQPTDNYSGATTVPVWYDALGVPWSSTRDLGAVHP